MVRDEQGIAQVYADTDADLMFAQGFVHAQDRFFEMDFRRHVTAGRLSEIFGADTLETDRFIRTMGWRRVAEREWALLEPATRDALTSYAAGVNAYIADRSPSQLAAEYSVLGLTGLDYSPAEWDPIDSLAWLKAMAWDLRGNMDAEVDRVLLSLDHTEDEIASLWPAYPFDEHPPIVSGGGVVDGVFEQNASGNATRNPAGRRTPRGRRRPRAGARPARRDARADRQGRGIGSNSWVVDGEHSATGKPILANDPHLGISQPGIWMQMGLHCRARTADCTLDTSGFTFSGVPGVIIGHNADIAWGLTNLGPDVTDLFLEQTEGDDRYVRDGATEAMEVHTETIKVRGEDDVEMRVRETVHGPLISDVSTEFATVGANAPTDEPGERGSGYAVALAWTALEPAPTADAILALNRASDWDSFRAAAADFSVPAQNLVYADREGHIGYQSPGRIPIRRAGNDGTMPVGGLGQRQRLDRRVHPLRRAAERARPGGGLHRDGQPGRHRRALPLPPDEGLGLRLPLDAHPRAARERGRAVGLGDGRAPARLHQPDGRDAGALPARRRGPAVPLLPQRPGPAARLGLHLAGRQRRRRPTSTSCGASCSTRPSTTSCAQRTWPDGGDRWFAWSPRCCPTRRPVVGRRDHRGHGRDPRRHPAPR